MTIMTGETIYGRGQWETNQVSGITAPDPWSGLAIGRGRGSTRAVLAAPWARIFGLRAGVVVSWWDDAGVSGRGG